MQVRKVKVESLENGTRKEEGGWRLGHKKEGVWRLG
jgi:hypothetical protein